MISTRSVPLGWGEAPAEGERAAKYIERWRLTTYVEDGPVMRSTRVCRRSKGKVWRVTEFYAGPERKASWRVEM